MIKNICLTKKNLFVLIFSIIISLSLNAQTTLECDSLTTKIKTMANRHVENDENMKTEHIVSLFQENPCGFSQLQIADIYEEQYILSKSKKSSFLEIIKPNIGWIGSVLGFILASFLFAIRKLIFKILSNLFAFFYGNFSSSRVFRRRAMRMYKKSLFNKYKKVEVSFRPGKPLEMADIFIPLKVVTDADKNEETLEIEDAITLYDKVIIVGKPGSGKSMFCKNILFKYSTDKVKNKTFSMLLKFHKPRDKSKIKKIPILIELHRLSDKAATIFGLLENELTKNNFPKSSNFLKKGLDSGNLFILFDGYDEITSSERNRVTLLINDFIDKNEKCQYVITSRPAVYDKEFINVTETKLKLVDFNHQQIRRFLHSWWSTEIKEGKSVEQLIYTLQDRPRIMSLATNPLMLTMIACLYADTEEYILPHSRAEFYDKATMFFLEPKNGIPNKYNFPEKSLILQHLALYNQEQGEKQIDRKLIHFTKVIEEIRKILPNINRREDDILSIFEEIVERSGLLIKVDGGEHYQFAHLTMQEYFAAKQIINKQEDYLLNKFKQDWQTWRETIKLWCGLSNDATKMISYLYEIEPIIAFECISEAKKIDHKVANEIINYFIDLLLDSEKSNIEIEKAFGVLAADTRQRGENIFNLLASRFDSSNDEKEIEIIGNALSYTYLPKSAIIISNSCFKNQELYNCLIRMGDIAVDELLKLSQNGDVKAIIGLKQIATPRAGLALFSLIWNDNEISKFAAWCLADLISNSNVKNVLKESELTQVQLKKEIYDWAYQSSDTQKSISLQFVIGRIVYLMTQPIVFEQDIDIDINPTIAIPVIINQFSYLKEPWAVNDNLILNTFHYLKEEKIFEQAYKDKVSFKFFLETYNVKSKHLTAKEAILLKFFNKNKNPIFFKISDSLQNIILEIFLEHREFGTKYDWINLLHKDIKDYEFNTSKHYKIIFTIFSILSLSSIVFCLYSIKHCINCSPTWKTIQIIGCFIMIFNVIFNLFFRIVDFCGFYDKPKHLLRFGVFGFLPIIYFKKNKKISSYYPIHLLFTSIWTPFLFYYNYLLLKLFLPIISILLIALVIIGVCCSLAIYGVGLEKTSMNPLKALKKII